MDQSQQTLPAAIDRLDSIKHPAEAKRHLLKYIFQDVLVLNFYRTHMLYFIGIIAISSVIVYGEGLANGSHEIQGKRLRYVDALFLCCSAAVRTKNFLPQLLIIQYS
jgi:hypothetical protein